MVLDLLVQNNLPVFLPLLAIVGFITGFIGSMGGSGGLILLPFMISCGMPPATALGTARLGAMWGWIVAARKFSAAGQVRWKQLPLIASITVIAGVIGTYLIIDIDEKYIYPIVGTILVTIPPLMLFNKEFGLQERLVSHHHKFMGYGAFFLAMLYGGFFGAGAGAMAIFVLVSFLGFRTFEAHATEMASWIIMSIFSSVIFIIHGHVHYPSMLVILVSLSLGSYIGSHYAIKGGDVWVKKVVCIFAIAVGLKLLIWP
jgi:uncharacterized membrane protein YfcA